MSHATSNIRNVAVVGHSHTGKTSLVSALLFDSGAVTRLCKVDDGNTTTDFDEDEIERKITINTAVAHFEHRSVKLNLLDTPGYGIYTTEAVQGLRVADCALLMVSAVAGVEVQTEKMWKAAEKFELPAMIAVNLMDRDRASFERTLETLRKKFGREVVPIQVPIGAEHDFRGVVDLISGDAFTWSGDESGAPTKTEVPADLAEEAASSREALMEMVAEQDEELMEAYLEAGELDPQTLAAGLKRAMLARGLFPVFAVSATKNIAVQPLMDALVDLAPAPDWRPVPAKVNGEEQALSVADGTFAAYVFKTISDPYTGRISLMRVFSGGVTTDATVANVGRGTTERLGALSIIQGKELEHVSELAPGDIGAVPKLKETHTGDTLCAVKNDILIEPVPIPESAISFALEPKSKGDEDKLAAALSRIRDEDPTISVGRDAQTKEMLISGTGQLHVEVVVGRLKKRYKVDVELHQPKVPYRETITASAEVTTRHKKQTGGSGQFAECKILMAPGEPGSGYEFIDKIYGGSISQGYRPAVDKGIQEAAARGVLAGYPMVDFTVTLLDGKEHSVDSSEMAFKIAGRKAFKECAARCKPTMLEPIMQVEAYIPEENMGDIMGDLNSRRGRVQGMDSEGGTTTVKAQVPLAEMLTYSPTLRSITGGRGDFHMEFSHYAEVPKQLQEKIVAAAAREELEEED